MRLKFLLLLSLFLTIHIASFAQQDCITAIPLCGNTYSSGAWPTGGGAIADLNATNSGCLLTGESNTRWYVINISQSGTLVFTLEPTGTTIADYDFAIWDITGAATTRACGPCDIVHKNLPVRCNWAGLPGFGATHAQCLTGLSVTATNPSNGVAGPPYSSALPVTAGQSFIIAIDNTGGFPPIYPFTLDFSGSTCSITDTVKPTYKLASSTCGYGSDVVIASMPEPVQINSIAPNGSDFYVTNAAGTRFNVVEARPTELTPSALFTSNISLRFANALPAGNYTLHAQTGSDGNTLLDNCGNQQDPANTLAFTLSTPLNVPVIKSLDTPACKKARLIISRPVMCSTIAANGSDFRISGPSAVNVISATPRKCFSYPSVSCSGTITMTDTIDIVFDRSIQAPGTYSITVETGSDGNSITDSCSSGIGGTYQFVVSDKGYIATYNSSALICQPEYITLTSTLTVPATAVKPGFAWSPAAYMSDSTVTNPVVYVPSTTTYTVRVTDTNNCYRRASTQIVVSVRNPKIEGNDTAICKGESFVMTAVGGGYYSWYPPTGLSCVNCQSPTVQPTAATTYHAIITNVDGCADTLARTINVNPLPSVNAGRDTTVIFGNPLQLYAYCLDCKYYYWEPSANMDNANIPNPIVNPKVSTSYVVFVVDGNYCKSSDTVNVNVRTDVKVFVPGGFTPNNDGHNDRFRVGNLSFQRIVEFRVFNRWGQEVFQATDNKGWDGTVNGVPADMGNYEYLIRVAYPEGTTEMFKGDVALIR